MIFELSGIELERVVEFKAKHKSCAVLSAIGGQYSYTFVPTDIGTAIFIECSGCGEKADVSDYDCW